VRLSRRGRKPGWGKKHAAGTKPKTFKNFLRRADAVLKTMKLLSADFMALTEAEMIDQALARYARVLAQRHANRNPVQSKALSRLAGEPDDE
jgi:hypothetical protein